MSSRRSLRRPVGTRLQRKKIIVYSEGKNTEPGYLYAYARHLRSSVLELVFPEAGAVPRTLAAKAIAKKTEIDTKKYVRENGDRDSVWVVFDRDEHLGVDEVIAKCEAAGVGVAYSNPCFELWLILHVADYDKDEDRHKTQDHCASLCVGYRAGGGGLGKTADWNALLPNVLDAEGRAAAMKDRRDADGASAPITTVHKLTSFMRQK